MDRIGQVDEKELKKWAKYMSLGGERQTLAGFFQTDMTEIDKWMTDKESKPLKLAKGALNGLEMFSNMSEWSTRFLEFSNALDQGKSDLEAMHMANQITVPFSQMGAWGANPYARSFIKSIAFFNPALQVNWKLYQTLKDNPQRVAAVFGSVMSMVGMGLGAMLNGMDDEEREKYLIAIANMPIKELTRAIYFPSPIGDSFIRLRIPEQFGSITALAYMGVVNHSKIKNYKKSDYYEALTDWIPDQFKLLRPGKGALESMGLTITHWMPHVLRPTAQAIFNKRLYPDIIPIVPDHMSRNTDLQYTAWTSDVARVVGQIVNISPIHMEHYIRGHFGAVGGALLWKFQANPLYRQMQDYSTKGALWNEFYESKGNLKASADDLKHGMLATPKEHWDLHIQNKLYDKMGNTLGIIRKLTNDKYFELPAHEKALAKTIFGNMPTISKKSSQEMMDLLLEINNYDFSAHSSAENLRQTAALMDRMKVLTIRVGKPVSLTLDDQFMELAKTGQVKKSDYQNVWIKNERSKFVNSQIEAGVDEKTAVNNFEEQLSWMRFIKKRR